jgi:transposase
VTNTFDSLPSDVVAAHELILAERAARREGEARAARAEADLSHAHATALSADALITRLRLEIEKLRRTLYGVRSERKERLIDQLEMQLEDAETAATEDELAAERSTLSTVVQSFERRRPARKPFPEHLPRERVVIPAPESCPCCGSTKLSKLGEDVTETLEVVPRQWKVIQTVRERFSCRQCEAIMQPPAPFHVTPRGFAGPSLLAMILFEKFGQHQPLNRQSERYAREGIDLSLSTLTDQVGACAATLKPLHALIERHVLAAERLHGDDTTVPILAKGQTETGRIWVYVRDDRPFGGKDPPAALFYASRDRTREHPERHLAGYAGVLQADAFDGYNRLYLADRKPGPILEALCWSHARRKFFELADIAANARRGKNAPPISPIALEAVKRIDALFAIEREINGLSAAKRLAARRERSAPLVAALESWMRAERSKLSRHAAIAKAIDYMLTRWEAFTRVLEDGCICLSNNAAERALRGLATTESFCAPSSSVCKHGNLVLRFEVTRAAFAPHRSNNALALKVGGPDLVRRASDDLLCRQNSGFDQPADAMARNPTLLRGLSQGQPGPVLLGGAIGVDTSHAPDRSDTVRCPGFALAGRQSHAVQSGGDVLIRPAGRHAADDGQGVVRGVTVVAARPRLAEPELGVLAALPVDDQNDLTRRFIDVDGDLVHQRSQQLLSGAHRDAGRLPRDLQVLG